MKAGYERDKDVYVFAALFNSNVITNRKLRKLYEEEHLGGDLSKVYLKHFGSLKKKRSYIGEPFSDELRDEVSKDDTATNRLERIEAATVALQSKVAQWSSQFQAFKGYAIAIAIFIAVAYWFKK